MTILLHDTSKNKDWFQKIKLLYPEKKIALFPDEIDNQNAIEYAIIWNHPKGDLKNYPNLKAIFLLGAGVEHIFGDDLPDVPIVRLSDPVMLDDMAIHAIYWVIHFHRHYDIFLKQQQNKIWKKKGYKASQDFQVAVLGIGQIGMHVAEKIASLGYAVVGWSKSKKQTEIIQTYAGEKELETVLRESDAVILCLPSYSETVNMFNSRLFQMMKPKSYLINIGRGKLIVDSDLIDALNSGQLAGVAIDVFREEPLHPNSPYWTHPNVFITPHIAGINYARTGAKIIVDNIKKLEKNIPITPIYNPKSGY